MDHRTKCSNSRFSQFCWDLINMVIFSFSLLNSHLKLKGTELRHQRLCCLCFSLPNIINPIYIQDLREIFPQPGQNTVAVCNQITLLILYFISPRPVALLKILMPVYMSLIFFILLLVSSSSILTFIQSFFVFLKYLLVSGLTLFRLSILLWLGTCTHCFLAGLL